MKEYKQIDGDNTKLFANKFENMAKIEAFLRKHE